MATSPDGRLLATGDDTGLIRFVDLGTWQPSGATVKLPQPVVTQAMTFSPDGRTLAVGTGGGANPNCTSSTSLGDGPGGSARGRGA